jgi:hypothetical protein
MTTNFLRSVYRVFSGLIFSLFVQTSWVFGADSEPLATSAPIVAPKPETAQGPTVIRRRATILDEYTALPKGDSRNRVLFNVTYSFGEKRDYGLTVEVPYSQYQANGVSGNESATGLGDIRTFLIHPFATQGKFIHSYALETYFNTASASSLGQGSTTLLPSYALTYRHSKAFQLIGLVQYQFDVQRDDGEDHVRTVNLRPFMILNFPSNYYSISEVKAILDLKHDNRWNITATTSLGRLFGERKQWAVFGVVGGPLNDFARDFVQKYQLKAGVNYFF